MLVTTGPQPQNQLGVALALILQAKVINVRIHGQKLSSLELGMKEKKVENLHCLL
jgi:hypothetical protein